MLIQRFLLFICIFGTLGLYASTTIATETIESDMASALKAYDSGRYDAAYAHWKTAAQRGNTNAMSALANMYGQGEGRPKDLKKAALWYKKAAQLGNIVGQLNYGQMLENGIGVKADRLAAYVWYRLASRSGNQWSTERQLALVRSFTPSESAAAEKAFERELNDIK